MREQDALGSPLEVLLGRLLRVTGPAEPAPVLPGPQVSPSEARALFELLAARGIAQGELASLLGLEKSTISRLAAGLERKGWVRRTRDAANQRYVRLHLTPEGRAVAVRLWRAWRDRQARILGALTGEERAALAIGLGGLVRALAAEGLLGDMPHGGPAGARTAGPVAAGAPPARAPPQEPSLARSEAPEGFAAGRGPTPGPG